MSRTSRWICGAAVLLVCGGVVVYLVTKWAERETHAGPLGRKDLATAANRMYGTQTNLRTLSPTHMDPSRKVTVAVGGFGLVEQDQSGRLNELITAELSSAPGLQL